MQAVILGSGFTGPVLKEYIHSQNKDSQVFESSRQTGKDFIFDSLKPETWKNIPKADYVFWLFPAEDLKQSTDLFEFLRSSVSEKIIICSSTGFFKTTQEDERVTEETPINLEKERPAIEESLRERGASIVHAAGIYGKDRHPIKWLKAGRVGPSKKFVNFIHVEDLAQFLWKAAESFTPASRWIASDGHPSRWTELAEHWQISNDCPPSKRTSKYVDPTHSIQALNIQLAFPSVKDAPIPS